MEFFYCITALCVLKLYRKQTEEESTMYYAIIVLSTLLFGCCFAINDAYRRRNGETVKASLCFSLFGAVGGIFVLLAVNGASFEFTWFTFIIAMLTSINSLLFTFFGFKALGSINLSLYSLYSMLGGAVLPFLQGILFYGEKLTLAKALCLIFVAAALFMTVNGNRPRGGTIYYAGIFILNGMSGVLSKFFTSAPYSKTSVQAYSLLTACCGFALNGLIIIILLFFRKKESKSENDEAVENKTTLSPLSVCLSLGGGVLNNVANFLLVLALMHVDASCQYPLVTGGVIIVSTAVCFFKKEKPYKKEIISVILAFIGMLAVFLIPV